MKPQVLCSILALAAPLAFADGIQLNLSANAQREVANDQISASLYVQQSNSQAAVLADKLNKITANGLAIGRNYGKVQLSTGSYNTWPSYDKNGKISGWQGRAEINLKSRDFAQAAELIAKLQQTMLLEGVQFGVSDEARRAAEQSMIPEAIANLKQQAEVAAKALDKSVVDIRQLDIGQQNHSFRPPVMMMKAAAAPAAESVSQPDLQPGQSQLQLQVSGKVELK
ncbi:SIMPL domain-containing protein [Chromobacterium sp. IIBBL 290-4]|uniref:SIMPL domain-containing protein n=1 Tax=Chromobacterium sp. IIBBL 290-4 TaxID=2953890 RepID=UPI0020B83AF6|nr:SIMPL domain-containing protein [Chromobacterium sp. IIBBL 290-4]UTH74599.1 SIMPL domain-containing protein [Chromobacterium sp. IIBBL 290-4]